MMQYLLSLNTRNATYQIVPLPLHDKDRMALLVLRLLTVVLLVTLLTMHVRSLRVFRWEQSVSGGVLVTYTIANLGLVLCAGTNRCGVKALQVYLCSTGAALLVANGAAIWRRWTQAPELTRAVMELLDSLGVHLKRQLIFKTILSLAAAICMLIDLVMVLMLTNLKQDGSET